MSQEPVFAAPWEAQAFAMAVALQERGCFTATEWAEALGAEIAGGDPAATYYEHWLAALEGMLATKGLAEPATLEGYRQAWARAARTPHGAPIELPPRRPVTGSVLASTDWVAVASIATAGATLILAIATFASVRSGNRTARAAEQSLAAQLWPLLAPARPDDPEQKVMFQDHYKVMVPGGQGAAEATPDAVYLAIAIRNYGPGLAILDRWSFATGRKDGTQGIEDQASFRRLTRDLYIPPGDVGFWQGAIRDPADPAFGEASGAIGRREEMTIEMLYSDHLGNQHTVTRFTMLPASEGRWIVTSSRHFNLDGPLR